MIYGANMIIVDDREPEEIQLIADEIKRLEYGDIVIDTDSRKLILERKTIPDLFQSLFTGRLNDQLIGCDGLLLDLRKHGFEISKYFQYSKSGYNPIVFINLLNGISTHHRIFYFISIEQLKSMLIRFEDKISRDEFGQIREVMPKSRLPVQVRILSQYPGVGIEKAKLLLTHYGSIEAVEEAASIIDVIPGVGVKTLESINEARCKVVNKEHLC